MSTSPKSVKSADPRKGVTRVMLRAAEADLRAFRHDVAVLKRKGLIAKAYDARSVKPGKYILGQIRKFGDVLEGRAAAPKVSNAKAKYYREKGYTVKNNRVIVPLAPNEKVYSTHGDFRTQFKGSNGKITKIDLGLSPTNVTQWMDDLRHNRFKLKKNEVLSFQLMGHNSTNNYGYSDDFRPELPKKYQRTAQEQMADKLEQYKLFEKAVETGDPQDADNWIDGIVIFKIQKEHEHEWLNVPEDESMIERYREIADARRMRRARQRFLREGRRTDAEWEAARESEAERKRVERAHMTPKQKEAYKEAARKRAAASRARRKSAS